MDRMSSSDAFLIEVAYAAVTYGVHTGRVLLMNPEAFDPEYRELRATFVTLRKDGELRGCIGSLEPTRSLLEDVAANAFSAAFRDPRFPPVTEDEIASLEIQISALGPVEPLLFQSEDDLLSKLRPGVDGLVLREGGRRGTFLPQVWDELRDPRQFLRQLKRKAGLQPDHWSDQIRVERYTVESIA